MAKINKNILNKIAKVTLVNKGLRRKLREALGSNESIKTGKIDALVVTHEKNVKVYSERTSDRIYRVLIEEMHEGAVSLNKDGIILYCNSYFANMVRLPLQKVIGTKLKKYIDHSSSAVFVDLFKRGWKVNAYNEVNLCALEGTTTPARMSVNALSLEGIVILSVILTDLTVLNKNQAELRDRSKELEQKNIELENVNKDLTTFTYISSHDLQEPVRKIQNFVSLIARAEDKNLSDISKDYFRRLGEAAKRMQSLIEDLSTYASDKNAERKFEKTDLNVIIDEVK